MAKRKTRIVNVQRRLKNISLSDFMNVHLHTSCDKCPFADQYENSETGNQEILCKARYLDQYGDDVVDFFATRKERK